jgi:uncharacterized membrane protein YccF (DUF307 family)
MRFAGNVIWFLFGGAVTALFWLIGAVVFAVTIVGLPLTRAAIEMAKLSAWPFGREVVHVRELDGRDVDLETATTGTIGFLFNVLWSVTFGIWLCLGYIMLGVLWCVTLIGIPFGLQAFKLAGISVWPVGRRVVTIELARLARETAAEETFAEHRSRRKGEPNVYREPALALAPSATSRIDHEPQHVPSSHAPRSKNGGGSSRLPPQLQSDRGWFVEVVGEASYQEELQRAFDVAKPYDDHLLVVVSLQPEDDNPHDTNAVRVDHRGETLGYLPRAAARQYRQVLGARAGSLTGSLFGGENPDGEPKLFGVWLNAKWPPEFK